MNQDLKIETKSKSKRALPDWIRVKIPIGGERGKVEGVLKKYRLNTVCSGAKCPNLCECWARGTATFMILGSICTRSCKFCAVNNDAKPTAPEEDEPMRVAEAVKELNLRHVVITSVTRDDLIDGGAAIFAETVKAVRNLTSEVIIEVLIPDFNGDEKFLRKVLDARPDILNHNLETVRRLTPMIRSGADYDRSLRVLSFSSTYCKGLLRVKSGIMIGLGETDREIEEVIRDIKTAGAEMLTIGQYLKPGQKNIEVKKFYSIVEFENWKNFAYGLGFKSVWSGPMVRSSYMAEEQNCK